MGDGSSVAALDCFRNEFLPGMIQRDNWDKRHRFVVLSPQFASYEDRTAENVNEFVQYAKSKYRIDAKRIYFTAVSGGGVALGNYLTTYSGGEAAAVLPVSCYVPPIEWSANWSSVPVWFFCGAADDVVEPANVEKNYEGILAANPAVKPRFTLYTGLGHELDAANKTYAPQSNDNQLETTFDGIRLDPYSDIYDWLLQYRKP
jgi:predicted peptidase